MEVSSLAFIRIALLSVIVLFGLPGNLVALTLAIRSMRRKRLNSLAYVHLALVDLLLCSIHAGIVIVLESLDYYNYYSDDSYEMKIGEWEVLLKFLYEHVSVRLYMSCTVLSTLTLTFIAGFRTWRVFYPFGQARKSLLIAFFALSDMAVVLIAFFFQNPNQRESTSKTLQNSTTNSEFDFTASISIADRNISVTMDSGTGNDNSSSLLSDGVRTSRGLLSGKPMLILMVTIGTSVFLTVLFYVLICIKLRYELSKTNLGEGSRRQFLRRQVHHICTHVLLTAILIITVLPAFLYAVIAGKPGSEMIRLMNTVAAISSAVNPYVYSLLLPGNRQEVRKICGCSIRNSSDISPLTNISTINCAD